MGDEGNKLRGRSRDRVLLIEGDRQEATAAEGLLRGFGFAVALARDAAEALSFLAKAPRLILLRGDPVEEAVAFLGRLRKVKELQAVPAIACSVTPLPLESRQRLEDFGVVAFTPYPLDEEELADALHLCGIATGGMRRQVTAPSAVRVQPPRAEPGAAPSPGSGSRPTLSLGRPRMPLRGVAATLLLAGARSDCMIEDASFRYLDVRCFEPFPAAGSRIKVEIDTREALDGPAGEGPLRIAGLVESVEPGGAQATARIKVGSSSDERGLERLVAWLAT